MPWFGFCVRAESFESVPPSPSPHEPCALTCVWGCLIWKDDGWCSAAGQRTIIHRIRIRLPVGEPFFEKLATPLQQRCAAWRQSVVRIDIGLDPRNNSTSASSTSIHRRRAHAGRQYTRQDGFELRESCSLRNRIHLHLRECESTYFKTTNLTALQYFLLGIYNVFFHPLRHYPGPLLWRASPLPKNIYMLRGLYAKKAREIHETYQGTVRVAPNELSYIQRKPAPPNPVRLQTSTGKS